MRCPLPAAQTDISYILSSDSYCYRWNDRLFSSSEYQSYGCHLYDCNNEVHCRFSGSRSYDDGSRLSHKTLMDANIPEQTALISIAVKENDNATDGIIFNLTKEYLLKPGQTLIVLGEDAHLNKLKKLAEN